MTQRFICPICQTEQNRSKKKIVASQLCCNTCQNFIRAQNSPYPDRNTIELWNSRIESNSRFPYINAALLHKVAKDIGISGTFTEEKKIIEMLSLIRKNLSTQLEAEILKFERYHLLTDSLNLLDLLFGEKMAHTATHSKFIKSPYDKAAELNIIINRVMGLFGKALERLMEFAISHDDFRGDGQGKQPTIIWFLELQNEIVSVNQVIEDVVSLWHRGTLIIDNSGWTWELHLEDQKTYDKTIKKWSIDDVIHHKETYGSDVEGGLDIGDYIESFKILGLPKAEKGCTKLDPDDEELIIGINADHSELFGHKYSEKLMVLLGLTSLPGKLDKDWIYEDEIVNFLSTEFGLDKQVSLSVLEALSLSESLILSENAFPFEFSRKYRLIRRPLPKVQLSKRNVYYVSVPFLWRSFLQIQIEYWSLNNPEITGSNIEKRINVLNQHIKDHFVRERVYPIFLKRDLKAGYHVETIASIDLRKECGEIDIIAYNDKTNNLIIGECKHRVSKQIHVSQIRNEIRQFNKPDGHRDKLRKKLTWIENNIEIVLRHLGIANTESEIKCVPLFITNIYFPVAEFCNDFEFVTEHNLDTWLKNHLIPS